MEEEGAINFKALRAKFQEEAALAQSRSSRPAVAEKPKHLPPPGGHCISVISSISTTMENMSAAAPRVLFRDALRSSGGKRPISFPPEPHHCPPLSQFPNGDGMAKQCLKDRHLPLVLPMHGLKEHKTDLPFKKQEIEPVKEAQTQTKIKKKGLLLPFKSSKTSKVSTEEPTYADLTARPASAPGELPSLEKQSTEDGVSLQGDPSDCPLSSPDIPITPPSVETTADSDTRAMSTLEKAKKKFSRRQMLVSAKPKSLRSPDCTKREKLFPWSPKKGESVEPVQRVPSPVYLPHLACISARPFFKANTSARFQQNRARTLPTVRSGGEQSPLISKTDVSPIDMQSGKNKAELSSVKTSGPLLPFAPPKKPLPDLRSSGLLPVKPPRPPLVDLSCFYPPTVNEVLSRPSQVPTEEPETLLPSVSKAMLDAPEFPDFENSEMETADGAVVDIAALELEALDFVGTELPMPNDVEVCDFEDQRPDLCDSAEATVSSIVQDLNLGSQNIIPLDPSSFPEPINLSEFPEPPDPDDWNQSQGAIMDPFCSSRADETELSAAECHSAPEEFEPCGHVEVDDRIQPHPSSYQQDSNNEAPNNVYEDVESINRFVLNQRKHKISLKNPYGDNHAMKEEASHNIWSRNLWGSVSGEHAHTMHNHVQSKERQSPNAAEFKEQKKKEKQRLEREKKEQKEREKKENEMKKKFKVTGEEEPMYHAKVMVASKVRKNDLPVKSGDTVSIIRTTNCPKGRWLARDANHKYGYISVMNVELNIKEMLELGKKAQAAGRSGNLEGDTISIGSRSSSHPVLTSSFTDDSEEWAYEDETLSPSNEAHSFPQQSALTSETSLTACGHASARHTLSDANLEDLHTQTRHEALQKLAIFFQHSKEEFCDNDAATPTNAEPPNFLCAVEEPPYPEQEVDFTELELLPPPPLYADTF